MKVASTVPWRGKFSNKSTYSDRPYAALLQLTIVIVKIMFRVDGSIY